MVHAEDLPEFTQWLKRAPVAKSARAPEPPARWIILALLVVVLPSSLQAAGARLSAGQSSFGATVEELLTWAEQHNPELAAMQYEVEAAKQRIQPAGALADPMLSVEWRDISRDNPTLSPERVGSVKYTVSQAFPLAGKRALKSKIAEAEADQSRGLQQATAVELRAKIKTAFAQRYLAFQMATVIREIVDLLRDIEHLARERYANNLTSQQDVIRSQAEQTDLRTELITLQAEQRRTGARLNALLGRTPDAPLAEPHELPAVAGVASLDALTEQILETNPLLFAQDQQVVAARRAQRLTQANRYPDLTVALSAIQREERLDGWELMLAINIPLWQETRRSQEREVAAQVATAQMRYEASALQIRGNVQEALAALEAAREQVRLLTQELQPQYWLTFKSALASYQTGRVDFATLLEALRQIYQTNVNILKAQVEQRIQMAEIERLVGEEQ
ncbi:MAG TPA: TolC family protein [Candidatus Competibacteraceae bacterium]|nr:TolC family protein [Candidatus Competibacteraceae bacterium]